MTDQEVLTAVQYALVEPPDGGSSWPSGLWTRDEILANLNTRQRLLLKNTQIQTARASLAVLANATSVALPADWIATLSAMWLTAGGARTPVSSADVFETDLMLPTWESTAGVPLVYLDGDADTLTLRLSPIPAANGTLELRYVALPTAALGSGTTLSPPAEFLDGVKYGVLADALGKIGRGADPARAAYAEDRFRLSVIVANILMEGGS